MTHLRDVANRNGATSSELIHEQLARMLQSRAFNQAPMLSRLLQYLVERSLEGDAGQLKEYSVGVEVFDRGPSFDPRTDTIVRVQVRRLRARLQEYYQSEGRADPLVVEIPTGHYVVRWRAAETATIDRTPPLKRPASVPAAASPAAAEDPSIVVLPFANLSGNTGEDYFSDGLTEEIISGLASVSGLRVVARTSAFQFKGRAEDVRKIGRDLGVRAALEGSVRKDGERIRVTAQLIDVSDGFHLWTDSYERELTGVFSIQKDITHAIVGALRIRLAAGSETHRASSSGSPAPEAYEWYLKGRHFYHKATPAALDKSVECMERAITCDPRYAAAFAGLADAYITSISLVVQRPLAEVLAQARRAAEMALQLDDQSAEAHCSMGEVLAVSDWDFAGAEVEFRAALDLKPSFVHARMVYSVTCLSPLRRHDQAVDELRQALASDPMSVLLRTMLGQALVLAGRPNEAVSELRQALELEPAYAFAQYTLALAHLATSGYREALDVLVNIPDPGETSNIVGHLGYARARLGDRAEARRLLQRLLERSLIPAVDVAAIYNGLGKTDKAIEWLSRARQAQEFDALFVGDDPRFRNLWSDPRLGRALQ